jgi:hypothetical protein
LSRPLSRSWSVSNGTRQSAWRCSRSAWPSSGWSGLGFIIPVITITCQLGTSLRIPVVGALLLWAVLVGVFFDNHQVGRRALIAETGGATDRPTLESAFRLWAKGQPAGPNGKTTMVLVAVQGGAARAGYWTAVALAQLQTAAAKLIPTVMRADRCGPSPAFRWM